MGDPNSRPRLLVTTVPAGAGHRSVAAALVERLRAEAPQIELDSVDVLDFVPRWFRAYYAGGFAAAMSRFPRVYGFGFWLKNRPQGPRRGLTERRRLWHERRVLREFVRYVRQTRPSLVVHTHFFPAPALGRAIERGVLATRQWVVVTDIRVHRFWYAEGVEHWFAPYEPSARTLQRWGVAPADITVCGIPIQAKWTAPVDRAKVLADWDLPDGRPIVLLTGGTDFVCGPVERIARGLLETCPDAVLVVLTGRNEKLRLRVQRLGDAGVRMRVVPFTDRLHELVEVCSVMVSKAGGVTVAECMAKGRPMVLLRPVPGQESGNAEFVVSRGAGVLTRKPGQVVREVQDLLADAVRREQMSRAARALYQPACETIVTAIRRAMTGGSSS